jgi:hypothetical protein
MQSSFYAEFTSNNILIWFCDSPHKFYAKPQFISELRFLWLDFQRSADCLLLFASKLDSIISIYW